MHGTLLNTKGNIKAARFPQDTIKSHQISKYLLNLDQTPPSQSLDPSALGPLPSDPLGPHTDS